MIYFLKDFPDGTNGKKKKKKHLPAYAGDTKDGISISGSGKSPGEGNGNPLQYLCLGNPMDRKAWQAPVHGVTKSRTVCTLGTSGKRDKGTITLSYSFKDSFESGR